MASGRILVIRGGAIGDFIVTLPVLSALRRQFPSATLELVAYPAVASLALESGLVDAIRPIESRPLAGFFARRGALDPEWSEYFAGVGVLFTYLFDPDELFRGNLARVTKAQLIQGPHRPEEPNSNHVTTQLLEPLQRLAIFDADPTPRLTPSPISGTAMTEGIPCVAVHPGSGGRHKVWSIENWKRLLRWVLARFPVRLMLVGGEADEAAIRELERDLPADRIETVFRQPLPFVAGKLSRCVGFLGHDSGITHLAAACGRAGLVLWGPTDATVWRPKSERMTLIHAPDGQLESLRTETVEVALEFLLSAWLSEGESPASRPA